MTAETESNRIILYHQTHHQPNNGPPISLLPLLSNHTGITHLIISAVHLNASPGDITLNDHPPAHARNATLWGELAWIQATGVKVLAMLGGAAPGTFVRLDGTRFQEFYEPLRDMLRRHNFQGVDLDIEEAMSMPGVLRLIDHLRADFGPEFIITLAPVATGLLVGQPHLSGPTFDYHVLESLRGREIAWYNVQFYNGWGDASTALWYDAIIQAGWRPEKVVFGLLTNPGNGGSGYVNCWQLEGVLHAIRTRHPRFGGIMGWEFFNALSGDDCEPWQWVAEMSRILRTALPAAQQTFSSAPSSVPATPPVSSHPYPAENMRTLQDLGFSQQQAVAALNATNGNVEYAAGLLFQE